MPTVLTDEALDSLEDPNDRRVHLVRPETVQAIGNGLYKAITICGEIIVGYPAHDPRPATCPHCLAA